MYKIRQNSLFIFLILLFVVLTYVSPGFFQFFFGIPSTVYGFILLFIIYLVIALDIYIRKKILYNNTIYIILSLIVLIILSAIINKTNIFKVLLYLNFALIPLSVVYLSGVISRRQLLIKKWISSFFLIIILIQLPIVIIQKYAYELLIPLSNANQNINGYDFMFGSFALKADHALGFFLIIYLLKLINDYRSGELKTFPLFIVIYIATTVLIMESNLTKLTLILIAVYYISIFIYKKINIFGLSVIVIVFFLSYSLAMTSSTIKNQIEVVANSLNNESYLKAVKGGYAKRPHVVIYQLQNEEFKWIGNGPYDYYNIIKGEFKNTFHFSQLIWFYNDLGLAGLILGLLISLMIIKNLNLSKELSLLLMGVILLYLFMTNVLGDISMMLSLLLLNNKIS